MNGTYKRIFSFFFAVLFFAVPLKVCATLAPPSDTPEASGQQTDSDAAIAGTTRVIVKDFVVEGGGITPGATSKIVYTLKNTSASNPVFSVLVAWWSDSVSPVQYVKTNQYFVSRIDPGEEVAVEFIVAAQAVDMASLSSIPTSLAIHYSAWGQSDRTNNVMVRLPINQAAADEPKSPPDMYWMPPTDGMSDFLSSRMMKIGYLAGFGCCCLGIVATLARGNRRKR